MKKLLTLAIFMLLLNNIANAAKERYNQLCFKNATINSNPVLIDYKITESQPFESNVTISDDKHCININAGRKESIVPAIWVQDRMLAKDIDWAKGNAKAAADITISDTPDSLNFAVELNLNISIEGSSYTCNNIYLGQGSSSPGSNDWWVFSNNNKKNNTITCKTNGTPGTTDIKVNGSNINNHQFYLQLNK